MVKLICPRCSWVALTTQECCAGDCGHQDCVGSWWQRARCLQCGQQGLEPLLAK